LNSGNAAIGAGAGLYNVKGEKMRIVKLIIPIAALGALALMAVPSASEAACACSGIGQSSGYYASPTNYGGYGPGYGYQTQYQGQPVKSKSPKSNKRSTKPKSDTK
jgi:hypothetical protein